jgi:hypothetical protein
MFATIKNPKAEQDIYSKKSRKLRKNKKIISLRKTYKIYVS